LTHSLSKAVNPRAITQVSELVDQGFIDSKNAAELSEVTEEFRLRITDEMTRAALGSKAVADQFVPDRRELNILPEESFDPIGDEVHAPVKGLTHRYPDRVILHVTKTCEVYCRFCFRRETVGDAGHLSDGEIDAALAYVASKPQIWEIILTGGDPLVMSARRLAALVEKIKAIEHVGILRIHTRVPVVAPEKITPELVAALKAHPSAWLVVHTNHADEMTEGAKAALARLADAGIPLLSQSVLLRGINDSVEALEALFRGLIRNRVKPYYLHHCDLARGTSHFRTTIAEGQALMAALRGRLSGTCLPHYILDLPGGHGKVPLGPDYLQPDGDGWLVRDPQGNLHRYDDPKRD